MAGTMSKHPISFIVKLLSIRLTSQRLPLSVIEEISADPASLRGCYGLYMSLYKLRHHKSSDHILDSDAGERLSCHEIRDALTEIGEHSISDTRYINEALESLHHIERTSIKQFLMIVYSHYKKKMAIAKPILSTLADLNLEPRSLLGDLAFISSTCRRKVNKLLRTMRQNSISVSQLAQFGESI